MASVQRLKLKQMPLDTWANREKLCLAMSVQRSGDQNWVSVSRSIKPFGEPDRPADWFSQKNCAAQYSDLLEKTETPKRKRGEKVEIETPGDLIVRKLTYDRIEELKKLLQQEKMQYKKLKKDIEMIKNGQADNRLLEISNEIRDQKRAEEIAAQELQKHYEEREVKINAHRLALKTAITPMKNRRPAAQQLKLLSISSNSAEETQPDSNQSSINEPLTVEVSHDTPENNVQTPTKNTSSHQPHQVALKTPSSRAVDPSPTSPLLSSLLKSPTPNTLGGPGPISPAVSSLFASVAGTPNAKENTSTHVSPVSSKVSVSPNSKFLSPSGAHSATTLVSTASSPAVMSLFTGVTGPSNVNKSPKSNQTSPSAGAPTLSKLLEMPPSVPGKLPPLPVIKTEQPDISDKDESILIDSSITTEKSNDDISEEKSQIDENINKSKIADNIKQESKIEEKSEFIPSEDLCLEQKTESVKNDDLPTDNQVTDNVSEQNKIKDEVHSKEIESENENEPNLPVKNEVDIVTVQSVENDENKGNEKKADVETVSTPALDTGESEKVDKPSKPIESVCSEKGVDIKLEKQDSTEGSQPVSSTPKLNKSRLSGSRRGRRSRSRTSTITEEALSVDDESVSQESAPVTPDSVNPPVSIIGDAFEGAKIHSTGGKLSIPSSQVPAISDSVPNSPLSQSDDPDSLKDYKSWKKSIMLVWRAAANHKYANVFLHPVTDDHAPGYSSVVYRPMDLSTIKKNIETGAIRSTTEFQHNMMLMFQNAILYNSTDQYVYKMAVEMQDEVMQQVQDYVATQLMVSTSETKVLRGRGTDSGKRSSTSDLPDKDGENFKKRKSIQDEGKGKKKS